MRFLIDAQLPPESARWLEARGHEASHVCDILGARADDREVAAHAARETLSC